MSTVETARPLLEVRELTVTLSSGMTAVDRVSFEVRRGECLALVGESGCGKTLSALSVLRAIPEDIGYSRAEGLLLDGLELGTLGGRDLRRVRGARVAMVFQDPSSALDPLYRIGDQIVETLRAHLPLSRSQARRRALESLEEAGLTDPERIFDSWPHQLSGGQRQRCVIATALSTSPELLIADEPTTALDVTVQARILDLLAGLRHSRGLALLLITHNLSVVRRLADRVAIMYAGQIMESAPAAALFTRPAHPYTRALLDCIPSGAGMELKTISGQAPTPGSWPEGCRFRPRCYYAAAGCEARQELRPYDAGLSRLVRCHRAEAVVRELAVDGEQNDE